MSAYLPPANTEHQHRTPVHCVCLPTSCSCQYWASVWNTRSLFLPPSLLLLPILGISIEHQATVSASLPPAPANTGHQYRIPGHCVCLPTSCPCQYWASVWNTRPLCLPTYLLLLPILGICIEHQATVSAYLPPANTGHQHRTPGHCVCLPTSCSCQYWASVWNTRPLCLPTYLLLLPILGISMEHQASVSAYPHPAPANTGHQYRTPGHCVCLPPSCSSQY